MAAMEPVDQRPQKQHSIAIEGFDGTTEVIAADEIRFCMPTKDCVQFWATIVACFVVIALGVFFMIYQGQSSAYYSVGLTMIGLGSGVLIPGLALIFLVRLQLLNLQQGPIMVPWLRVRRPDSYPQIGMYTHVVQPGVGMNMKPPSRSRHVAWQKNACFKGQQSCLEFDAIQND